MILIIDNYDSFVFNIARYFENLGAAIRVERNDSLDLAEIEKLAPKAIVLSPGPCGPAEAGVSLQVLTRLAGRMPILGICLGHQCLGMAFGGQITRAREPIHGRILRLAHGGQGLFVGLPSPIEAGCYHSLIVEATPAMDAALHVDAWSEAGEILALSHRIWPLFGVQFHPESVLTPWGDTIFRNFLNVVEAWHAPVLE
ncbi:anthranilate synthase component II [Beijerinckia indica]|uniref:Glutamine amidotransferase of anthranilate synthase n=1 Tax=Beijerinckia indica subsp. indica (strain ATCC 9039 / DSM 1715 / NCIMB 8712) TaxID=395963 RepID=B2IJ17_BEII9|nr:aminodeoxychorismate/anthranilate synthase component II [Beijerinckia indica]ACB94780.1 glutamine amidotransferase of anthranilate synthase [Beijerinckia indica subsp. indica ATCC 9039]